MHLVIITRRSMKGHPMMKGRSMMKNFKISFNFRQKNSLNCNFFKISYNRSEIWKKLPCSTTSLNHWFSLSNMLRKSNRIISRRLSKIIDEPVNNDFQLLCLRKITFLSLTNPKGISWGDFLERLIFSGQLKNPRTLKDKSVFRIWKFRLG